MPLGYSLPPSKVIVWWGHKHITSSGPHWNQMCPAGLALLHPAAASLLQYATGGCPTQTGNPWTTKQMQAAINCSPHASALLPEAAHQLDLKVTKKVKNGQACLIHLNEICAALPPNLKISPIAMVLHKSQPFWAILDLSYSLWLSPTEIVPSVNSNCKNSTERSSVTVGSFPWMHYSCVCCCRQNVDHIFGKMGHKRWNFCYVLPSTHGTGDPVLVVPTLLQMGLIKSPP